MKPENQSSEHRTAWMLYEMSDNEQEQKRIDQVEGQQPEMPKYHIIRTDKRTHNRQHCITQGSKLSISEHQKVAGEDQW
jgi:hypothetical protein